MTSPVLAANLNRRGQRRSVGLGILFFIITLGFYGWYWSFKTHEEMKQQTGDGLGGVIGVVIWILISPVSAFVIPSEVGRLYTRAGQPAPVTGWTGLWLVRFGFLVIPAIVSFVMVQGSLSRYWSAQRLRTRNG